MFAVYTLLLATWTNFCTPMITFIRQEKHCTVGGLLKGRWLVVLGVGSICNAEM